MSVDSGASATKQDLLDLHEANKQDIGVLQQDIGGLKQDIGGLQQDIGGLQQDIGGLQDTMADLRESTKADIAELRALILARDDAFQARELRIVADGQAREDRILEAMRDIETHLLKEFINFARSNDDRVRTVETSGTLAAQRLATLEMRVTELEVKLLKSH